MNVILHLGLGSFHRAHQAACLNRLIEAGVRDWSIVAGNLLPDGSDVIAALDAQGGQYTLETTDARGSFAYERIRSIQRVVAFQPSLRALIDVGADPATRIISFTVTEGGYGEGAPLFGALQAILQARAARSSGPVTLLSCDNLRDNGDLSKAGLTRALGPKIAAWLEANTTWPNSMVDRITPRPTAQRAERVRLATGWNDRAPVSAERFLQWVMEDRFCTGRPPWERAGALFTESVAPYEEAKLRILNASHSAIAWAGTLGGFQYIHDAVRDPAIRRIAQDYATHEAIPCLTPSPLDLPAYRDSVLERFANPHLADTIQRVTSGSVAKIRAFILPTLEQRLVRGETIANAALLAALYFRFLRRWQRGELPFEYVDDASERLMALLRAADPVLAYCAEPALWGAAAASMSFRISVRQALGEVERA